MKNQDLLWKSTSSLGLICRAVAVGNKRRQGRKEKKATTTEAEQNKNEKIENKTWAVLLYPLCLPLLCVCSLGVPLVSCRRWLLHVHRRSRHHRHSHSLSSSCPDCMCCLPLIRQHGMVIWQQTSVHLNSRLSSREREDEWREECFGNGIVQRVRCRSHSLVQSPKGSASAVLRAVVDVVRCT